MLRCLWGDLLRNERSQYDAYICLYSRQSHSQCDQQDTNGAVSRHDLYCPTTNPHGYTNSALPNAILCSRSSLGLGLPCDKLAEPWRFKEQTGSLSFIQLMTQIASMRWIPVVLNILSTRRVW